MRSPLHVAVVQPKCGGGLADTVEHHSCAIREAGTRVVVFPELSLTGYELDAPPISAADAVLLPIVEACALTDCVAFVGAPVEEVGRRFVAALRVNAQGVEVAYRKSHLHGAERGVFTPGDGPTVVTVDGWRLGMGICRDTGVPEHTTGTAALDIDLYVAGVVNRPDELPEQDARGARIAAACRAFVAFASLAGPTGGGYEETAGMSTIWAPDGQVIARAGDTPGDMARALLT